MARFQYGDGLPGYTTIVAEGTFATHPGAGDAQIVLEGAPGGLESLTRHMIPDGAQYSTQSPHNAMVMSQTQGVVPAGTGITTVSRIQGYDASIPAADSDITDQNNFPLFVALKGFFGGQEAGGVTTVNDAGATTTQIIVTSGAKFDAGQSVWFDVADGDGTTWERAWIEDVSTHTLTLRFPLSNEPENGSTVIGCQTFYPTLTLDGVSRWLRWHGYKAAAVNSELYANVGGLVGNTLNITIPPEGYATAEIAWLAALGYFSTNSATELPATPTWDYPTAEQCIGATQALRLFATPATTYTCTPGPISIALANNVTQYPSPAATYGIHSADKGAEDFQVTIPFEHTAGTVRGLYEAGTALSYHFDIGSQPGTAWGFCMPRCQIVAHTFPESGDGYAQETITLRALAHGEDASTDTGAAANKSFYLAF